MPRVLIISPYFPPTNAADMQRIRMSLPYFEAYGWTPEVVTVDVRFSDMAKDELLTQSLPQNSIVHTVRAIPKKWTAKLGLGSIAIRSLYGYKKTVNRLLKTKRYDLIYFSTTQFPVCILGAYWKKRFGVPYVIDMQDPWHSEYYQNKPKHERPPKYWFSYRLNKLLEPMAMRHVDGLISVSEGYLQTLSQRYPNCKELPQATITFGAFEEDFLIARKHKHEQPSVLPTNDKINIVYVGRGGKDMHEALSLLFSTFKLALQGNKAVYGKLHFYFIGTSYAAAGAGFETISPLAERFEIADYVTEITGRIPFYQTLNTIADADGLFVPGSNDPQYTASKIYPYVLAQKPLLAVFHPASSVVQFLRACGAGTVVTLDEKEELAQNKIQQFLQLLVSGKREAVIENPEILEQYSARSMTEKQCALFNAVVS